MAITMVDMIRRNKLIELSEFLQELNPVDIAKSMIELEDKDLILVFSLLSKSTSAEIFSYLDKESKQIIVESITDNEVKEIIEKLLLNDTVDFQEMADIGLSEKSYLKTPVYKLAKNRIGWLLVLMISASITGSIIKKFDEVIQSVVLLAAFIPMLMDTGGNAGSQSSTLVIRGLALGDIRTRDYLKVMWKEFRVSLIVGGILSIVNFFRIYLLEKVDINIALTVCGSLFFTVILAKVVGCILPMIAKKMKCDPAIMAGPLITTVVDTFALIVYFALAKVFIGI